MIFDWWRQRTTTKRLIAGDAATLMQDFGGGAYYVARDRAWSARRGDVIDADRDAGHWDQVRAEIGRRTKRSTVDTATRYLSE